MADNTEKFRKLKKLAKEQEATKQQLTGELNGLMKQLSDKGHKNVNSAVTALEGLRKKENVLNSKLDKLIKRFDNKYADKL